MSGRGRGFLVDSKYDEPVRAPRGSPEEAKPPASPEEAKPPASAEEKKTRSPPPGASQTSLPSRLNADAQEFVPRLFSVRPPVVPEASPPASSSVQFEDANHEQRQNNNAGHQRNENGYDHYDETEPMQVLHEAIEKIATNPGCYDEVLIEILEAFTNARLNDSDCSMAADLIVIKAIEDSNFRYHAALLARVLSDRIPDSHIADYIMQRCHTEHKKRDDMRSTPEGRAQLVGFTFFMAEMFMNYPVVAIGIEKKSLTLLNGILDILDSMMKMIADEYWPAIVCVIKLCGKEMEDLEHGEYADEYSKKSRLEKFFKRLEESYDSGICKPKFKLPIERLNNLKISKWKDPTPTRAPDQPNYKPVPNPYTPENGWFDGFESAEEQAAFFADMDGEAEEFYEQFLRDSNQI